MPPAAVDFQTHSPRHPRPKLRLPKRRHVAKPNPGLNTFKPILHDINQDTFDFSSSYNGFVFGTKAGSLDNPNSSFQLKQSNNNGFVSGARNNCPGLKKTESCSGLSNEFEFGTSGSGVNNPNLNVQMKQSNDGFVLDARKNFSGSKNMESFSGLSTLFGFGMSGSGLKFPNLNFQTKQSSECRETSKNDEFGVFLRGGYMSGAEKSCSDSKTDSGSGLFNEFSFGSTGSVSENPNLNKEIKQSNKSCSNFENAGSVCGLSNGFVFCTSESGLKNPNLNAETKQSNMDFGNSNLVCKESNKNDEFGKFLSVGFVFGTGTSCSNMGKAESVRRNPRRVRFGSVSKQGEFSSDSISTKGESDKKAESLTSETKENAEVVCEGEDGWGFAFVGNWDDLDSIFGKTNSQSNENEKQSVPVDSEKMKSGVQVKFDSMGSVFGSSTTSGFQKVFQNGGEMEADTEVELPKEKEDDVFVFGSSRKENSSSRDWNKLSDEENKANAEDRMHNTSVVNDTQTGCFVNNKQNFVFGSKTCALGMNTTDKLSDEMRKLSFAESYEKGTFGDIKEPLINSCASSDPVFVFGSIGNPSGSCSSKSGTTKIKDAKLQGRAKSDGVDIRITNEKKPSTNASERSSNNASAGISTPKSFFFQAGQGKSSAKFESQVNDDPKLKNFSQSLFSSDLFDVEGISKGRLEGQNNFSFMSTPAGARSCATGFRTPNRDALSSVAENVSSGFNKYPDCSERSRSTRNRKWKKLSHKSRKVDPIQKQPRKINVGSQKNTESPEHFSPMDFSPYQADQCASPTNATGSGLARDEATRKAYDTSKGEKIFGQAHEEFSKNFWERFAAEYPFEQAETVGRSSRMGKISTDNDDNSDRAADVTFSKISNSKLEENEFRKQSSFPSSTEGNERNFGFYSISKEDNVSATKCRSRKKYRKKVVCGPNNIDPSCQVGSSFLHSNNAQEKERNTINSQRIVKSNVKGGAEHSEQRSTTARKVKNNVEGDEGHIKHQAIAEAQNACEKWRIRGNQAYEKGNSSKAEEYYTKGINSFAHKELPESSIEPLVLCYSNRAAARMLCGRMREALSDCVMADSLDPTFQKVQLRAANCHLALGEIEEACQYLSKCLESKGDVCLDRRIAIEAASGLQKAQKLTSCLSHCAELLRQKTSTAASSALESISAVFTTSSYSEKLLELKGEALLMLQSYKEVIQLCEQTLVPAENNFAMVADDNNSVNVNAPNSKNLTVMLWRWRLMSKSYFYLGKLELALDFLEKQEVLASSDDRNNIKESLCAYAATVRELLHHKSAGNRAFQSGKHTEAVEHYSSAVSSSIESRPFAAVCFCNRAAAQQALGQLSDAISDCSIAIALDGSYSKAVSRRATLHEKIRDYASATSDLRRLISLLKEQSQYKNCGSAGAGADTSSGNNVEEIRQAHSRLSSIEEKSKKGLPLDHYLILGVKSTDEASELKKAYRRAALRHHPDKAGQFLARGDIGDDGRLWKEICEEIQKDADRLFKMIGEAYAVLSDPNKRSEYDLEEELRNARKESNRNRDSTGSYDFYSTSSKYRRNTGRNWQESWKTYGYSRSQW